MKIRTYEDIDMTDTDTDAQIFEVERDNAPTLRFQGELVASASSSPDRAMGSSWSGATGRWTELRLYRTVGGTLIAAQVGRTQWEGERDRYSAAVCETEAEVIEFLGHRWLAQELYEEAGIENVEDVA